MKTTKLLLAALVISAAAVSAAQAASPLDPTFYWGTQSGAAMPRAADKWLGDVERNPRHPTYSMAHSSFKDLGIGSEFVGTAVHKPSGPYWDMHNPLHPLYRIYQG